jgi:hypothetical protein
VVVVLLGVLGPFGADVSPDYFSLGFVHGIGKGSHLLPQFHPVGGEGDFEVVRIVQGRPGNEQGDDRQRKGGDSKGLAGIVSFHDELASFVQATDLFVRPGMASAHGFAHRHFSFFLNFFLCDSQQF